MYAALGQSITHCTGSKVNKVKCTTLTSKKCINVKHKIRLFVLRPFKKMECPVCNKEFAIDDVEKHVQKCLFLNSRDELTSSDNANKRKKFSLFEKPQQTVKKPKLSNEPKSQISTNKGLSGTNLIDLTEKEDNNSSSPRKSEDKHKSVIAIPLAEQMRPQTIDDFFGQEHVLGKNMVLRSLLDQTEVPSMILWGPPGCGKTSLAHIIANKCKSTQTVRFVKLSATMAGVNDVKEIVKVAKNEQKFKHTTILFMDEIHRFNKLQQDIFLPHVESGTITLIGATTENPSFSLNNALLSRCRVIVLEKLETDDLIKILARALPTYDAITVDTANDLPELKNLSTMPKYIIENATIKWLAEMCDGDARVALNSLQITIQSLQSDGKQRKQSGQSTCLVMLDHIKDGIKRTHMMYDKKGEHHYNTVSALHKSIRASDDNAALYWCTRMLLGGDDPRFVARRLVRAASEDIGLADPQALQLAVAAMHSVQMVGMPECDVMLAHCAVYLARAPKSTEVYKAMNQCKRAIEECKGNLPDVPLHLRNAPTKLMKELGYGRGYNMQHKNTSGLQYMPEGMEDVNFF